MQEKNTNKPLLLKTKLLISLAAVTIITSAFLIAHFATKNDSDFFEANVEALTRDENDPVNIPCVQAISVCWLPLLTAEWWLTILLTH